MPLVPDSRYTQDSVAGAVNTGLFMREQTPEAPTRALDVLAGAARQSTLAGAAYERVINHDPDMPDAPPGWDPLDHVQGFEDYARDLGDAQTPGHLEGMKARIQGMQSDREVLHKAGFGGTGAELGMSLMDPSFYVAAAVPEIGMGRYVMLAKTLTAAARGAAGAAAYEGGLQQLQEARSTTDSLVNIGGGALLSGVLGNLLHRIPVSASKQLRNVIDAETSLVRSEAGAAATARATTLEQESLARGAKGLSGAMAKAPLIGTDLDKVMASESITARTTLQDLADIPQMLEKNKQGIATPNSVEAAVGKHDARVADFMDLTREQWKLYRERVPADQRMSKGDFYTSIASASRRGDSIGIAEVDEAAKFLRSRVFDPLKEEAEKLGLFAAQKEGGEVKVTGAESYFRRMYDRDVIRANLAEWHQVLFSHFTKDGAEAAEVTAAVEDVTRKILHADVGQANFATQVTVPAAGPLKERTLDIPDALIEKFLVNDPTRVARSYVRELAPQVEMAKRFGDIDMKQQLQSVTDEYNIKREAVRKQEDVSTAEQSKELKRLTDQEKETLEAIVRVRDRVLGRAGRLSADTGEGTRRAVMAARGWRNFVASSKLGGTALTGGLMDVAKITAQYGFLPTITKLTQLVRSPAFRDLSTAQARRVGSAVEVALSRRVQVAYEGALTEGWTQKMADGVYKYTGLSHMTDFTRTLSATLMENSVLKAAGRVSEGKALGAFERSRLASLGLGDDELAGIAKQIEQHGGEVSGIRVSGSADWTDKRLADIYDAAILKESKIAVQQPGAADRVWWMDKEIGKFLGQLKTFSLSSPARLLSGGLQMAGHAEYARAARFFGFMMVGGYLTHSLRQLVAGKLPTTDPGSAASEAIAESGITGVLPDITSPLTRRLGVFGESVRYADRSPYAAYGGPSVGAIGDTWDVLYNRTQGGISASDLHALRRILPYQNVWWLRREINALEGELAEGLELKDYDTASFGERFARTESMAPKAGARIAQNSGVQQ